MKVLLFFPNICVICYYYEYMMLRIIKLLCIEDLPHTANMVNSFFPSISKPTRITEHTANLIDKIYLNKLISLIIYQSYAFVLN